MLTLHQSHAQTRRFRSRWLEGDSTAPLLRESFGPWPHCQALVWEQLVDFDRWTRWMPGARSVNRLDTGPIGRGSRIQVDRLFHSEIWEIIHWHCHQRVDFEIVTAHCRVGFSVRLSQGMDPDHAIVRLDSESEQGEQGKLLGWLAERRLKQSGLHWLRGFSDFFAGQNPPID